MRPHCNSVYKQNGMVTRSSVLQLEVLIRKLPSVDRLPSSSIVVGEISTLKDTRTPHGKHTEAAHRTTKESQKKKGRSLPGTWTEGSPCGKLILCNQSHAPLCTALWSSLQGKVCVRFSWRVWWDYKTSWLFAVISDQIFHNQNKKCWYGNVVHVQIKFIVARKWVFIESHFNISHNKASKTLFWHCYQFLRILFAVSWHIKSCQTFFFLLVEL